MPVGRLLLGQLVDDRREQRGERVGVGLHPAGPGPPPGREPRLQQQSGRGREAGELAHQPGRTVGSPRGGPRPSRGRGWSAACRRGGTSSGRSRRPPTPRPAAARRRSPRAATGTPRARSGAPPRLRRPASSQSSHLDRGTARRRAATGHHCAISKSFMASCHGSEPSMSASAGRTWPISVTVPAGAGDLPPRHPTLRAASCGPR